MRRILIFYKRDWRSYRAGSVEHYMREVFSRIAARGHYVSWISGGGLARAGGNVEARENIQLARFSYGLPYCLMMGLVLKRLATPQPISRKFDAVVEVVNGKPLAPLRAVDANTLPVVFRLGRRVRGDASPPGPIIAATAGVAGQILAAGTPDRFIVRAPFGFPAEFLRVGAPAAPVPTVVAACRNPKRLFAALRQMRGDCAQMLVRRVEPASSAQERANTYAGAWLGWCDAGFEWLAPEMAACGLPVVCPFTEAAREFVTDKETGLLYAPHDSGRLAAAVTRLALVEALRKKLGETARRRVSANTWERTAGLVLGAIDSLRSAAARD